LPASRFLCEHLHQTLFWACISRIHAQVPLVTSGKLTESLHQQIPCGIDVLENFEEFYYHLERIDLAMTSSSSSSLRSSLSSQNIIPPR
jgi:hypothetical protein